MRIYVAAAAAIVAVWVAGIVALNYTLFSPAYAVNSYLNAMERGDIAEALARVGLDEAPIVLPDPAHLVEQVEVSQTLVVDEKNVLVSASYVLGDVPSETVFSLTRLPRTWGLFDRWEFSELPLGSLRATIDGATALTINGVSLPEDATSRGVEVLYPGRYTLSWSSGWVESDTVEVSIGNSQPQTVELSATPTDAFLQRARDAVDAYLDTCTDQAVLQPAGCPFGVSITDRVVGDVSWEVNRKPNVLLTIAEDEETIAVSALGGEVNLSVSLQSLFDGSIRDYQETQTVDVTGSIVGLGENRPQFIVD